MRSFVWLGGALALCAGGLAATTLASLAPPPERLPGVGSPARQVQVLDRSGLPLSVHYGNEWNVHSVVPYHGFPPALRAAFVEAEDHRFFEHRGVDWRARAHAAVQNVRAGRVVRGASTITEQSVRLLHPRPRTLWSRWLEGIEASRLEAHFSKREILEFYLNQVPYARQRRGVAQAANDYFARDLDTLSTREMLALAVLVRSPSRLDLIQGVDRVTAAVDRLAERMIAAGRLDPADWTASRSTPLVLTRPELPVEAGHFVRFVRERAAPLAPRRRVRTTLDGSLQIRVQRLLDRQVSTLGHREVGDGAALAVDHASGEILAWVNAGGFGPEEGAQIDVVLSPRQPGSTLKPFLYGLALERGWTAATLVEDAPLAQPVGNGLHGYRNYSRAYHGPLRVREALANSLNTPAVRTAQFVGRGPLHALLRQAGFDSLTRSPEHYGDGLALGNGEVTLFELVRGYAAIARGGEFGPLRGVEAEAGGGARRRVFSREVASILADVLSDPEARRLEFGRGGLLEFPVPTAVKTGTSNAYRDAWAVGFSSRYTAGVWMGNLDRRPMRDVTGSVGPAVVLRGVFAELHRHQAASSLAVSRRLSRHTICRVSGARPGDFCPLSVEWFRSGHTPTHDCPVHGVGKGPGVTSGTGVTSLTSGTGVTSLTSGTGVTSRPRLESPVPGLHLAMDPRIPDELEAFPLRLAADETAQIEWLIDGEVVAQTAGTREILWTLARGKHVAWARVRRKTGWVETEPVRFRVK